ncbi:MAG: hydrogenase maturation protease [Microvirga sp.]|jgi:hydrogenase maturation protease|nr:hydrogenase maturation protease [Microvirga sp.]
MADQRRLIVGIGNPDRGDDAIGFEVIRLLCGRLPSGVNVLHHAGEATTILNCLQGADVAFLVDAAVSGAEPGTVRRFDAAGHALPSGLAELSSHGLGLAQALELARALGSMPRRCVVYAVEGHRFEPGTPLSPEALRGAVEVADRILDELRSMANRQTERPMHEASLMANLLRQIRKVAAAEQASRVVGIKVWCGALSHMSGVHFAEHFAQAAAGTIAEGAALDVAVSKDLTDPRAQDIVLESVDVET